MIKHQVNSTVVNGGTGVLGLVTAIFAAAKVFGFSDMSWVMVFSPLWGPAAFVIAVGIVIAVAVFSFYGIMAIINMIQDKIKL